MKMTPAMQQFWDLKQSVPDALLFYRMGDFYELFGQDAITASEKLGIAVTSRDRSKEGETPLPMAGVPWHSAQSYIQSLLDQGFKVAIAEQLGADGKTATGKDIVKRDIVRILTPGLHFENTGTTQCYIATVLASPENNEWSFACLDLGTGDFRFQEFHSNSEWIYALDAIPVRHFIKVLGQNYPEEIFRSLNERKPFLIEDLPSNAIHEKTARSVLLSHFGWHTASGYVENERTQAALGTLLWFALKQQKTDRFPHLKAPRPFFTSENMILGLNSAKQLNLVTNDKDEFSLFDLLNRTQTAPGARKLKEWILHPLKSTSVIQARAEALRCFSKNSNFTTQIHKALSEVYDLERICGRLQSGTLTPRDLGALGKSLQTVTSVYAALDQMTSIHPASLIHQKKTDLINHYNQLRSQTEYLKKALRTELPLSAKEGGLFQNGVDPELDRLITLSENGERALIELEERERANTGIPNLRIKFSRVFGYSIEVTSSYLNRVPPLYVRKQTMAGGERYITEELKRFEDELLQASDRRKALEYRIFSDLISQWQFLIPSIISVAEILAEIDVIHALSYWVKQPGWNFPVIFDSGKSLKLIRSRHPLIDQEGISNFVPNDLLLADKTREVLLITGPNMGGKSTLMRQAAITVVLGQLGAPVPADQAEWGLVSSIYTRIGAQDAITRGQSTFMVEMTELSHILSRADAQSLILLDEIGRGTSTYDGISVAWSTVEWIKNQIQARTLFATHYHELTRLSGVLTGIQNVHLAVEENENGHLRFLYKLQDGATSDSYGIQVAKMAGIPDQVIDRAWDILKSLENNEIHVKSHTPKSFRRNTKVQITDQLHLI